jgi:hypothetical protein
MCGGYRTTIVIRSLLTNAIHGDPNYCIAKVDHLVGACEALQSSPNYQKFS